MIHNLDLLIKGGRILDGTDNPAYEADIGITGGQIAVMARDLGRTPAERVIDADVVIFDPKTVIDNATFDDPSQPPTGIHRVIGTTSGRVLRKG